MGASCLIADIRKSSLNNAFLLFGGVAVAGFAVPTMALALISAFIYFPIGSALPQSPSVQVFVTPLGAIFVLMAIGSGVLFAGTINAVFVRRWRPLILAVLFTLGACLGFVPGFMVGSSFRAWAFESFSQRSMAVVDAIERYQAATGSPPASLSGLVPDYLPAVPKTGMAAYPAYEYEAMSGPCSIENKWHLWVEVREFIDMNRMLYCPQQDYGPAERAVLSRAQIGTWVHDHIDF